MTGNTCTPKDEWLSKFEGGSRGVGFNVLCYIIMRSKQNCDFHLNHRPSSIEH